MTEREEVGMDFLELESVPLQSKLSLSISSSSQTVIMIQLKSLESEININVHVQLSKVGCIINLNFSTKEIVHTLTCPKLEIFG